MHPSAVYYIIPAHQRIKMLKWYLAVFSCFILMYAISGVFCKDENIEKKLQERDSAECRFEFDELPQSRVVHSLMEQLRVDNYDALDAYVFAGIEAKHLVNNQKTCEPFPLRRRRDDQDDHGVGEATHLVVRHLLRWLSKLHRPLLHHKPKICEESLTPPAGRRRLKMEDICKPENVAACMRQRVWDEKSQDFYAKGRLGRKSKSDCFLGTGLLAIELLLQLSQYATNNAGSNNELIQARVAKLNDRFKDLFGFLLPELSECLQYNYLNPEQQLIERTHSTIVDLKFRYHVKRHDTIPNHKFNQSIIEGGFPVDVLQCVNDEYYPKGTPVFHDIATMFTKNCIVDKLFVSRTENVLEALKQKIVIDPIDLRREIPHLKLECIDLAHIMRTFVGSVGFKLKTSLNLVDNTNDPTSVVTTAITDMGGGAQHLCLQSIIFRYLDAFNHIVKKDAKIKEATMDKVVTSYLDIIEFKESPTSDYLNSLAKFKRKLLDDYDATIVATYLKQLALGLEENYESSNFDAPPPPIAYQ